MWLDGGVARAERKPKGNFVSYYWVEGRVGSAVANCIEAMN